MGVERIVSLRNSRKPQVAAYVRVSSLMEAQDESYEAQAEHYEKFIRGHTEWEFAGVYGERISGTHSENRPEFQRMIEDAIAMKIDIIYCKSVSRWARNAVEALESIKYLTGNNVRIIFEQEGIDTKNPSTLLQLSLASAISQSESESISENIKWLYRKRAERGIYIPNKGRHFGYNTDAHTFVPDGNAKYVRLMFERFAEGRSMGEIEKELKGVTDNNGKPITKARISQILKNEIYVGDKEFGKVPQRNVITGKPDEVQVKNYVRDHHEPIVSRKTWDIVQARLEREKLERDRAEEKRKRMLKTLRADPGMGPTSLAKKVGVETNLAKSFIHGLKKKGVLIKGADGRWMVTD